MIKFHFYSRCLILHNDFPVSSIAVYVPKESLCKISVNATYSSKQNLYVNTDAYNDIPEEIAFDRNTDRSLLFKTPKVTWEEANEVCMKHNGYLWQPHKISSLGFIFPIYGYGPFHFAMHLRNEQWFDGKGALVSNFFWGKDQPDGNGDENCGGSIGWYMRDYSCDTLVRTGFCVC